MVGTVRFELTTSLNPIQTRYCKLRYVPNHSSGLATGKTIDTIGLNLEFNNYCNYSARFFDSVCVAQSVKNLRRFHNRLRKRWMRMHAQRQILCGRTHLHRNHTFRNQFTRAMAHNADAENPFCLQDQ